MKKRTEKEVKFEAWLKRLLELSGDAHNIFTPFDLCEEVIAKLPSLDGKILVVANLEFLYTLSINMDSMEDVYFATPNALKAKVATKWIPEANILRYDNVISEEDVGDMIFDVVVGNPPYQPDSNDLDSRKRKGNPGRLFTQFVNTFRSLSKTYAIIIPSTWLGRPSDTINKQVLSDSSVEYIIDVTHHFPFLKGRLHVCAIIANEQYVSDNCNLILEDGTVVNTTRSSIKGFMSAQAMNILSKLSSATTLGSLWRLAPEIIRDNLTDTGSFAVAEIVGGRNQEVPIRFVDNVQDPNKQMIKQYRVIVNVNASKDSIGNVKYIAPGLFVTQSLRFFPLNSESESINLVQYMESSVVQYIAKTARSSNGNSKAFFNLIPLIDLTRSWTDEELYIHFNLTDEEVNLIEDTIS